MMLRHPALNQDFIAVEDEGADPYAYRREESVPQHVTTEIKYGHPVARSAPPVSSPASPELKKMIAEAAASLMEQQRPAMMKEAIEAAMAIIEAQKNSVPSPSNEPDSASADTTVQENPTPSKPKAKGAK